MQNIIVKLVFCTKKLKCLKKASIANVILQVVDTFRRHQL